MIGRRSPKRMHISNTNNNNNITNNHRPMEAYRYCTSEDKCPQLHLELHIHFPNFSLLFLSPFLAIPTKNKYPKKKEKKKNALHERNNPHPRQNPLHLPPHRLHPRLQPHHRRHRSHISPHIPTPQRTPSRSHRPHHHPRPHQHPHPHGANSPPRHSRRSLISLMALRKNLAFARKFHRGRWIVCGEIEYCGNVIEWHDVFFGIYVCGSLWV